MLIRQRNILTASLVLLFFFLLLIGPLTEGGRSAESKSVESKQPVDHRLKALSSPTPVVSDGFDFPLGSYGPYSVCPDNKGSSGCYWICRGYQDSVNNVCVKTGYGDHLGEDWNRGPVSNNAFDFGETIYAVSNGEVIFAHDRGPENCKLQAIFPERNFWVYKRETDIVHGRLEPHEWVSCKK